MGADPSTMWPGAWTVLVLTAGLAGAAGALAGCSSADLKAREAVRAGLEAADANRAVIERLLSSPELQRSSQALTRAVLDGALADLATSERQEKLRKLAGSFVDGLLPALGDALDQRILPHLRSALVGGVQDALDQVLRQENRQRGGAFAAEVAKRATAAVLPQLTRAIAGAVRNGIEKAVERVAGDAASGLASGVRAGSRDAFLGLADALKGDLGTQLAVQRKEILKDVQEAAKEERQRWLDELHAERDHWLRILLVAGALTGLLVVAGVVLVIALWRDNRRLRSSG